jgi:ABC-type transport system substrate-binding protein
VKGSYWDSLMNKQLSRRRALTLAGGSAAAAALLAACGGSDDKSGDGKGLLAPAVSTTNQAKKGGTAIYRTNNAPPNFDPIGSGANVTVRLASDYAYPQMISFDFGTVDKLPEGKPVGEGLESWEVSPDGMTYTFKIRRQKLDPRPPTNGREMTTEDAKWSLDLYSQKHPGRANLINSVDPEGAVASIQYPDKYTMVMRLAYPTSYLLGAMGSTLLAPYLMPVEADGKFDVRNQTRGPGPFMLTEFEGDIHRKYVRNPNFWGAPDRPFLDAVEYYVMPETAAWQSQFAARRVWSYVPLNDTALDMKQRAPETLLNEVFSVGSPGSANTAYYLPGKLPGSIFLDQRVRWAISMLLNRDVALDVVNNISKLEQAGIPMRSAWNGTANALWSDRWLDPKSGKLGKGSEYFKHNPDEAIKLLKAANAFGTKQTYTTWTTQYSGAGQFEAEVLNGMLQEGGAFNITVQLLDLNAEFLPKYHFAKGQFEGLMYKTYGGYPDFGLYIWNAWMPSGRNAVSPKPVSAKLDELARKHRAEFDEHKRRSIEEEWQKDLAIEMPTIPWPGVATTFSLTQPWFGNGGKVKYWGWPRHEGDAFLHWYDAAKDTR